MLSSAPSQRGSGPASAADSNLADHYEKMEQLDIVSAELLARDQKYLKEGEHGGDKDRG